MSAKKLDLSTVTLDAAFREGVRDIFETKIVFNQTLGLKIDELAPLNARAHIAMRPELVGHFAYNRVHGGVISAALDAMGGLACMCAIGAQHHEEPVMDRLKRFAKLGTIDLRVDYLRPAIGETFILKAEVLRLGSRVATTRMEFCGADGTLLSAGAAAYIVS
ncbi:thioesterase family protein [Variovorax sp. PCZ-1]|uniref:thioesterase family protein n=1 Tax=Variovorax sp. PCZ-1 TaxID=2835533 RepID=UPI001BD0D3D9|nr:thioesterase family protein [Variovorax sp. PCZ-1]MBS7809196.1 thioesterase family protein [Variovorax sp. PCZ-1]